MIITVRDKDWPAYRAPSSGGVYADYKAGLAVAFRQARMLPLDAVAELPLSVEPSIAEIRRVFDGLGLRAHRRFSDGQIGETWQQAWNPSNPYES